MHTRADELMRTNTPVVGPDRSSTAIVSSWTATRSESHLRADDHGGGRESRVVGFISHPEQVAGVVVGPA